MDHNLDYILQRFRGDGPYLYIDGKKFIDAASGTFNLSLGYTNNSISARLKAQIDRGCHLSSAYTLEMSKTILKRLRKHLPDNLSRIWLRDVSGSGAVECAIRMAQKRTGRAGVISLYLAHHGQTLATAQISGNAFRIRDFKVDIPGSVKIPIPPSVLLGETSASDKNEFTDLDQLLEMGTSNNIACMIIEPILGNGGNIVLSPAFYKHIRGFCRRHDVVLIADEVQTCFGRPGSFFASTGYASALDPDILVFAKGATGIGIPIGGVLMRPELDVLEFYEHSSTSGANPLSLIAMDETISIIEEQKILENVRENEPIIRDLLLDLQSRYTSVTDVRGLGYMYGFDTPSIEFASDLIKAADRNGLIIRGARYGRSTAIKIRPPLICKRTELEEIFEKLEKSIKNLCFD